jgi:hypothetical protein
MATQQRIRRETTSMDIESLCDDIKMALDPSIDDSGKTLIIPEHQRHAGVWPLIRQKQLISSVRKNHPIPSILMGSLKGEVALSLEDGLQRLNTFLKFYKNELSDAEGNYFKDYTPTDQAYFCRYSITVEKYSGADHEARIEIFDNRQNGSPLTSGERLYAHSCTRLVSYTINMLLTSGKGLYGRFTNVWGYRGGDEDKKNRRKDLLEAVALVAGIAHGPAFLTKKYDILRTLLTKEFDENLTTNALERLLEVYEQAQINCKCHHPWLKKQYDVGLFSGYIVYSMYHASLPLHRIAEDDEWEPIKEEWIRFITSVRTESEMKIKNMYRILEDSLHRDMGAARAWTLSRWEKGYLRVFDSENDQLQHSEEDISDEDVASDLSDTDDE